MKIFASHRLRAYPNMDYQTRLQQLCESIGEPDWEQLTDEERVEAAMRLAAAEDWVSDVKPKHKPPEGTFKGSAQSIAAELKKEHGDDFAGAMSALNFYINRGGADLPNRDAVEGAKDALRKLYGKG